jgi:hypothetical protein
MRVLGVAAAVSAGVLLAACKGGGGTSADTTTQAQTADQFRRQADAICRKYEDRLKELGTPTSIPDLKEFVTKAVPLIEQGNDELHGLTPPDELQADWDAAMEIEEDNLDRLHDLEEAVQSNDLAALQTITKSLDENQAESERLAQRLGLHDCGEPQTTTITTG